MAGQSILDLVHKRLQDKEGEYNGEPFTVEIYFHRWYRAFNKYAPINTSGQEESVELALTCACTDGLAGYRVGDQRQSLRLYPLTAVKEIIIWEGGKP